jgi:hypothetical protein
MHLRRFVPTPSMAVSIVALVVAAGGVSYAAATIGSGDVKNNSLTGKDIKNLTGKDVKNNSLRSPDVRGLRGRDVSDGGLTGADIADGSLGGADLGANTVGGDQILESSLGAVPSATDALNAQQLGGRPAGDYITNSVIRPFRVTLQFGEKKEFLTNGPIGLEADCRANISGNQDELRILAVTRENGAFMQGDTPHSGPGVSSDTLDITTPEDNRTMGGIVSTPAGDGQPAADDDIDTGFVAGPNGQYIGIDETTMYALKVGGSDCLLVGLGVIVP